LTPKQKKRPAPSIVPDDEFSAGQFTETEIKDDGEIVMTSYFHPNSSTGESREPITLHYFRPLSVPPIPPSIIEKLSRRKRP